ncbi:RICIN domain-containing protein [Mucilaginibacter paludis]|uniref:Ricin B lectin domain-containing protein n=1 Tax=Mucilaginibacter paludis DSM 18603 TaxID=714943 RepID=H1YE22_9SPHI|nr:RICIN domain-containing protein [Mucilaginibacter paludis]EHQ25200.1 hypothetical protein Mucpa_1027 [Mucilaginibacter paludis DSM 18603]
MANVNENQRFFRGAIPSPRYKLAAAKPHEIIGSTPPNFLYNPANISFWGNDQYGDCVTAEEAFAKACYNPEIFISDQVAINWASANGFLNGAYLSSVLEKMVHNGFIENYFQYNDGVSSSVDWTNANILQNAIAQGPVKIGVAADQLNNVVTPGRNGWFAANFNQDHNEDHCVSLCGYGTISWLATQFGVSVPPQINGNDPGYAMFTWNSIGIIDVPSMIAITAEAWLRNPTTNIIQPVQYLKIQVKSSGQYLNILNASQANGAEACQGDTPTTDNFLWQLIPSSTVGYYLIKVASSGQYLNILNASQTNGAEACQGDTPTTDNFLWKVIAEGDYIKLQVKSSGQYLNIAGASQTNGAGACQADTPTTDNFLWKLVL